MPMYKRKSFLYVSLYLALMGAVSAMLYTRYEILTGSYTQVHVHEFEKRIDSYQFMQQRMMDNYYGMFLSSPRVAQIMVEARDADEQRQAALRHELHGRMKGVFDALKEYDTRVLFFHLPNQIAFLRVHEPEKFGDSLTKARPSIVYAQRVKKKVMVYETGKFFDGFRTIYPLYYQGKFGGTVEIAYPFLALKRQAMHQEEGALTILIKRSVVASKATQKDLLKNYQDSLLGREYIESKESALEKGSNGFAKGELRELFSENKVAIQKALNEDKTQALIFTHRGMNTMMLLKPVKEMGGECVAYMVEMTPNHVLYTQQSNQFFLLFSSIASLLGLLMWYVYRYNRSILISEQYREAVEESMIVSRTDPKGIITYVNDKFIQISGYSEEELLGHPHSMVRHPNTPATVFKGMWRTVKRGGSWHGMLENRAKNGESYFVKNLICPIMDENGTVIEYLGLREDVSEIQKSRISAQEAQRIKAAFVANMSHEIRTPINGIWGYVHLLSKTKLDSVQKRYVTIVESSLETLLHIVNDVLDYSKIEEGKIEIEYLPSNPKVDLRTVYDLFVPQADIKNIQYTFFMDETIANCLMLDTLRIKQVLSNLISNALKFTPQEGSVEVNVEMVQESRNDQMVKFSVRDTGIGIAKEKQSKIFEKFTQADSSTTRQFGGTGLGLSIAYAMVELMGAVITIDSAEGQGATFSFVLRCEKCDESIEEANIVQEAEVIRALDIRVLVVDDNLVNRMLIGELLSHYYGITADNATNGEEAVEMVMRNSYDLVFMDINMPVMDGTEATRILRQNNVDLPIIALTANVMQGDIEEFTAAGMNDYLSKPLAYDKLNELLMRYFGSGSHSEER